MSDTHSGKEINDAINRVRNIDTSPTEGSDNLVTSGGVFEAINSLDTSKIVSLKDYSKPSTTSALSTNDTLNQALGKLEKSVEETKGSNSAGNIVALATID